MNCVQEDRVAVITQSVQLSVTDCCGNGQKYSTGRDHAIHEQQLAQVAAAVSKKNSFVFFFYFCFVKTIFFLETHL